ncbi:unnamed protein product [Fusarium langsethiae]|nr:unnamed protein product [Fusarium langsethiae]
MQRDDRSRDPEGSGSRRRWYESRDRDLTPRAGDQGDSPHSRLYSRQQTPHQQQQQQPYSPMYQSPTQQRQYDPQRQDQFQMYQQSPQQNPALPPRPQQYQYPYQNQYHQQPQPYYSAPPQSMPGYNSPYQQQQNPQRPQTPSSVFSSSSDTSTSLLDISRFKDTKEYGGLLGTFFKAPSDRVKQRLHRKKSKKRRVLYFGNSSSSSVNSDLAYGNGYVRQPKSRTLSPRSQSRVSGQGYGSAAGVGPGPSHGRRRSSGGSDRAARLTPKKKKTADEEIMALGQQLSNLARLSKEDEQRQARKASGKGKGKAAVMGLAAGAAGAAMASQYGKEKNGRMVNGLKQRVESSDDEDEWEDASEDEDDDSSSSDGAGSAADSELAYGTVAESIKPALGAAAVAGSAAAAAGMADSRRQSSYGYDSSPEYRMHRDRGSVVDPRLFGPYNSLRGSINTPCGFRNDDEAVAYRRDSANFGNGTPIHMRDMYSDPNRYDGGRFSTPVAQQDPSSRPAPVPLQQPVPKTPVSSKVYDAVKVDDANRRNHRQRRPEQPEEKDWSGVAAGGLAAAAAAAAAGVAMASSSKKDSREHRDEQQRDRDDRDNQRRIDRDRQRALELEEQKLRELERQKLRAQQRAQNPESEADRHERLEKERARNMKWEREYREMEPEAVIPNYNNERKSSRYNDHDDTPKDRNEKKEKSNVDVVVTPKSDQNEGRPFGIQYGPEFQLEREPTVRAGTDERKATRNGRDLPLATGAGHQAVTEPTKSAHQDIDPFQYQVSDDAFTMSQGNTPGRPLTPNVVTIEREPNFDDSPPRDSAADARLSRRDSFEIRRMVEDYHRESQGAPQRGDPRNGHEYEEEEHKARSILDEAKHATIPVAAAAVASAVAVENERSEERRKARHSEDNSRDTSRSHKDAVQEEADRYYRETNIARKIASDEMRSRSASPERSVVDKWQENRSESFTIVTPPVMEEKHLEKSIYEGPDADVKIDNKIHPREEHQYRNLGKKSSRRNVSRERPLLNLIYPTPAVSRQHTPAPEARKEPEATEVVAKPEHFSIGPKGEIISVSEPVSAAKSVSWGENETKRFDADSPEKSDNDNYFPAEKAVEKSRHKLNKASRWGILAAALAGSSAEPQNEPDVEVDPKQTEMPGGYSYSDAGSSDVSIRRAEFYVDDMNSFPPVVGTKPASPQQMPGRFADDFEFAATLAAGLKDTGFNPDIVIDDPSYSRRDSPPGVQEANGDSHSGSNGNAWYKRPYAEVAPEPVDAPKLLPERGFVLGEVETPQEKTTLAYESERDIRSDAPKPEDVPLPDNQSESPKSSKREQRKREKSDVVVVQDDGRIETARTEPSPSREVGEAIWEDISHKKSKKDRKKDRKSRDFDDDRSTSQDDGRDRDISVSDFAKVAVPATLALGAIASGSRDASSRDVRTDMSDSPEESRKQLNDDYYYDGDRPRVSAPAQPPHHRHSSRDVASWDARSDDEHDSSKHSRKHKKDRESRDEGRYRESSTLDPNDRRSSRRESSRDRSRDRSRHRSSDRRSRDHSRDHKSRDRSRDRSRDHRSRDHRSKDRSRDRSHRRRSDNEEERPKRSKRHPYGYDSPTQSMAASEISVASSSSKRSKKSRRRNGAGDDYDDSRDSPSHRKHDSFDDRDVSSVVSESRGHRQTSSRYDDDDTKSVASVPGSSRREKDYKERRTPEKRPSTSVLSGLFKPRKDKKDSFLGNADTLGAGVGLATAADIYASDATRSNAADAPSDREPSASGDGLRHVRSFELVDPEVIPRVIKPAIDPQYGDLLPLPPSEPSSPTSSVSGELPPLPDSRPDTPPEERAFRREPWPQQRRRSIFETPMKSPSRTAVPIALRLGNRSSNPASPVSFRASPASSPIISHSDAVVMSRRQARPTSWDNSREFMPLYLLEQSRHPAPTTGSVLPALPPSEPSETSARNSPESEFLKQNDDYFGEDLDYTGPDLCVDTVLAEQQKDFDAESQQTTPRAEFMPVLPEPTPSVHSSEPTPGLSEPKLPEPTPTAAPDPPTPSLATPIESGTRDMAGDEHSAPPPFDAAAIAVPVGLGASAGLAAALRQARDRSDSPAEKIDDLTSADEHFSDAIEGPSEQTSPGEDVSRSLLAAVDREPTSEPIAKSPYELSSETTTGAFTTSVNELVADEPSDVKSHSELAAERTVVEEAEGQVARNITDVTDAATEPSTISINEDTIEESIHAKPDADPANEVAKEIEEPVVKEVDLNDKSVTEPFTIFVDEPVTEGPANADSDAELTAKETIANQAEEHAAQDMPNAGETAKETVAIPASEPTVEKPLNAPSNADLLAEKANEKVTDTAADVIGTPTEPLTAPVNEPSIQEPTVEESTVEEPLDAPSNTEHLPSQANEKAIDAATDGIDHSTEPLVLSANGPTAEEPTNVKYGGETVVDEATAKEMEEQAATDAAAAFLAAEAETAAQAEAEEAAEEEEEMAALKSKKAKKLTKAEKTRLMTLIANSVKRAQAKAAETTPEPDNKSTVEHSVEEPVVEERIETQESTKEDSTVSAKDPVLEALKNIQEAEFTKQTPGPTAIETVTEGPSLDLTTEPIIEGVTADAPGSSPLPTEEPVTERLALVPETVEPSGKLETEATGSVNIDLPKSSDEIDITPQPELVVEDVSVTEPRVENTKEKTEDLVRESDNTSTALTPDAIVEPPTGPSVDVPAGGTAEVVEVAEAKPEQLVAERAVNEITTEEWDKMNAKDRKNMKKKVKKQGLELIIQDSFDLPAPADNLSKVDQPALSEEVTAEEQAYASKSVTAEPEVLDPSTPEPVPESSAEPSTAAEVEDVQEPAVLQGEEPASIAPEEPSHFTEEDTLPVNKGLTIQPETESTGKEPEVYTGPIAPASEHEPTPESTAEAPIVTAPVPNATPFEEKAVEELPESPSKSKKKKKKNKTQQPPQEEPTNAEPTTVLTEDTAIDSAPTPQAEREAFDAWTDPVVSIGTPTATPVDMSAEQSTTVAEDPLQPSTELPKDAPAEPSVDVDAFDAWDQPDIVANPDALEQEQHKPAETAEQLPEPSIESLQGEDAFSSKSKKKKKKKKGTKTGDELVTEAQDSQSQDKSLEAPEKATYDLTEPSAPAADSKPETIDNTQADEATSPKPVVSPKHDGVPVSGEPDDLDDIPYSPSSGSQSPSTNDVRKDRQGYFPSALRALPGAAGISAFKRMWGFQDQARAQNRMREAQPDVARSSSEIQPDAVTAEKSKIAEAKPDVPIAEVDSDKAAANKPLTSSDSHISEPLFSQGDAPVEESQATISELEPSQGDEPQNITPHVGDDVPENEDVSTAVEQPLAKTEDGPAKSAEIAIETPREIHTGAVESEKAKSAENPSIEIISDATQAIERKPDESTNDKPTEMTMENDVKPTELAQDDTTELTEVKPELVTKEQPNKTVEVEDTKAAEETAAGNTEGGVSGSKKKAKKNKKKRKGQDETAEYEANDSVQQDQAIQETPVEEVTRVSNEADSRASASESVAEVSRDIPEELSVTESGAKSDDTTEGKAVDDQPQVKPETEEKSIEPEALNRSQTDDKPTEGEKKGEAKIDNEPTQIPSDEEPMNEKSEDIPEAQPEDNSTDKLQSGDNMLETEVNEQLQNDGKLVGSENQEPSQTNHDAAQAEDRVTNPEAQLLPQVDDKPQVEAEESQQFDGKPFESHTQENLQTDDKPVEDETKEPDSDAKLPQADAPKEDDKLVQPEVVEQIQTDDKPPQAEGNDDNTVGSEAKYPSSSEKQADKTVSEEPTETTRDLIAMPSVDESLPSATRKASPPKAGSVAMKIREAENKALRQAEDAEAAKDNAEIEALLEKQSRRGGRLLKKDQKRLTTLEENVARRAEARAAREPTPQAAQEPINAAAADANVQKATGADAQAAQPDETRDMDVRQPTDPVNEATAAEKQSDISETQPEETSGEAETVGAGLLSEVTESLADLPLEEKPQDDEGTADTAPAVEPQEKTPIDNEVTEAASSKKSKKKKKRKSVSFSENGESQDPTTENTDSRTLATEPEQLDQTVANTEDPPAQMEFAYEEVSATQDMPEVPASEDTPVDVPSLDAKETEAPSLNNPENPSAENTTTESQAEGLLDATLDKAESEPTPEKKSKKKKKKKKDTSADEPEKQPEAESSTQATSESTSKVSDDVKDVEQEASSGTTNPTEPVDVENAEASLLPLGSETANIAPGILPTDDEQAQPGDGEKPVEVSPGQEPASAIEAAEVPYAVVPEQPPAEQPLPNIDEPDSPAKLSKKDKKKKKKADKKKAALEEEPKEPEPEPTASSEKGEVEEPETTERSAEDPKVTRDETSKQTGSKETPKADITLEGEIATPANEAKVPDTGNSGELPSEEPASPEDERGGFSLSQSQTDQKNKAKDSDFEIVQDLKTNHPTQPETVTDLARQDAAAVVVDEAQSQGSSAGTQRQEDKNVAVDLDPPVEPETKLESGLELGKGNLEDGEEFAGLSKKQIKKLKKARALAAPEYSVEAEMPKESGTSLEEAAEAATEAGAESESTPQTCAESAAETTTGAEQELGYETMNDPLPDIEETVPIIEPDFEAEPESKTENQSLDNTDIQPATEGADAEPKVDADLQTRQPQSDEQTTSEQDIIVPAPDVDSGDNLTDVPDKSSNTNVPAEHQVVKALDSSYMEETAEPPQMLGEPVETVQDSRPLIEAETEPVASAKPEQTDEVTGSIPFSLSNMAEKSTQAQTPVEAESSKPAEISQPLEEALTDIPAGGMDESAPEQMVQSPQEPILQPPEDPAQSSNPETVKPGAVTEPAASVETAPTRDTQPPFIDVATESAEQTPVDLLPSSDLPLSTPFLSADPSSLQQLVSEPTESKSGGQDSSITIEETDPLSVTPDVLASEDTAIPDVATIPISEESGNSMENDVEKQLEEPSQPHEPSPVLQPAVTGSLMTPTDSPLEEKPTEETGETEANQDISNEATIDNTKEPSVELTKDKPTIPVVENQQKLASHDPPLESSASQSDPQVMDDRYSENTKSLKDDAAKGGFEESAPSKTNVQETPEAAQDTIHPQVESTAGDTVPDTAALPDSLPNQSTGLIDTPRINESEKSERGENEFTTEDWQSLAAKEKKNIKKKLKRKGLNLIIQDSFEPTTSGSEVLPEAGIEPEPVPTQPEELAAGVPETETQIEQGQEAFPNKTSDKLTSNPNDSNLVVGTKKDIENDEAREQAGPTSQTTAGQKNIPTDSPSSQETPPATEVKSDEQEIAENDVVSTPEGRDKETAELEGEHGAEVPIVVETPTESEIPSISEEAQRKSGSQEELLVLSTAKNEISQETEIEITPVEPITKTEPKPSTSHETDHRATTPQPMSEVPEAQHPERLSPKPVTETGGAPETHADIITGSGPRESPAPSDQTPLVQKTVVVEEPSDVSPKKSKRKKKSRKHNLSEAETQASSGETNNAVGNDVQQETHRPVEDTKEHERNDKNQDSDNIMARLPESEMPSSVDQPSVEADHPVLDMRETPKKSEGQKDNQQVSPIIDATDAQMSTDMSPASRGLEEAEPTRTLLGETVTEKMEPTTDTADEGRENPAPKLDLHAEGTPVETERNANAVPSEDKKKKRTKKNSGTAGAELTDSNSGRQILEPVQTSDMQQDKPKPADMSAVDRSSQQTQDEPVKSDESNSPRNVSEKPTSGLPTSTPKTTFEDIVKQKPDNGSAKRIKSPVRWGKDKTTTQPEGIASSIFSMASSFFSQKDKKKRKGEPTGTPGSGPASPVEQSRETQHRPSQTPKSEPHLISNDVLVEHIQPTKEGTTVNTPESQKQSARIREPATPVEQNTVERDSSPTSKTDRKNDMKTDTILPSEDNIAKDTSTNVTGTAPAVSQPPNATNATGDDPKAEQAMDRAETATRQPVAQESDTVQDLPKKPSKKDTKKKKREQKQAEDEAKTTREAPNVASSYPTTPDQPVQSNPDKEQPIRTSEPAPEATESLESSTLPQKPEVSMQPAPDVPKTMDSPQLEAEETRQQGQEVQKNNRDLEKPDPSSRISSTANGDAKFEDEDGHASSVVKQSRSIVEGLSLETVPSTTLESGGNTTVNFDTSDQVKDLSMITKPLASPVDELMTQPAVPSVPESQVPDSTPFDPQSTPAIHKKVEGVNTNPDSNLSKKEKKKARELALEKELATDHQASDTPATESFQASKPTEPEARDNQGPSTPENTQKLKKSAAIEANDQDTECNTEPVAAKGPKKGKKAERETGTGSPTTNPFNRKLSTPLITEPTQPVIASGQDRIKAESDLATIVEPSEKAILPKAAPDNFTSGPDVLAESPTTAAPVAIPQEPGVIMPEEKSHGLPLSPQDKHVGIEERSSKPALAPSPSFKNDTTRAGVGFGDAPTMSTKEKKKRRKGSEQVMSPPESPAKTQKSVGDSTAIAGDKRPSKPESSIFARVTAAAAAAWGTKKTSDKITKERTQDEREDGEVRLGEKDGAQDERGGRASADGKPMTEAGSHDTKSPIMDTVKDSHQKPSVPREGQEVKTGRKKDKSVIVHNGSKDKGRETTGDSTDETKTPEKRLKSPMGTKSARQSADESEQPERQDGKTRQYGSTGDIPAMFEQEDKKKPRRTQPDDLDDVESPILGRGDSQLLRRSPQKLLRRASGADEPRGGLLREDSTTIAPILGMESDISDILRSPSRLLEPVLEVPEAETEPARGSYSPPPQIRRNSGPVGDASSFKRRSRRLSEESRRDSGVTGERPTLRRSKPRSPEPFRDSEIETDGWEHPQPVLDRTVMQTPEPKTERRLRRSPRGTPVLREPTVSGPTPEPEKKKQYGILTPVGATVAAGAGAGLASTLSRSGPGPSTSTSTPTRTPTPGSNSNSNPAASYASQRSFSDNASPVRRSTPRLESAGRRAVSNTSLSRRRTPEPLHFRPESPGTNRSSGTPTPPLRRADKRMSGDLRSIRQQNNTATATATAPVSSTPVANEGRARATKDMADVYDGFGEGRIGSPRSPTRPHSMRRRQSMQVLELENRVEQLMAENRMLTEARAMAETSLSQRAANSLAERDAEIDNLKQSLQFLQNEVSRLTEVNDGLASANTELANKDTGRVADLESRNAVVARELEEARRAKGTTEQSLEEKDAEIADLRAQLDSAKEKIRELQRQILEAKAHDDHFLNIRDEDHFDHRCQQLCSHVQQWVLRFSKFSDMRACRLTNEINDEKTIDRLDNAVLDGSDVDVYLRDRVKRRDIFMSMTMNMIWEFVFTRYLFGMDREQRQKLKSLEKLLTEVGPPEAVRQWRAVTLTLLAKRESFKRQRDLDTEAVVQAIFQTLCKILPPPTNLEDQIQSQLRRVMREAVGLSIEMRTQKAEYMMLPPLRPEYDADGELTATVQFNASMMNERSGSITTSNEDLEAQGAIVRVVLFPLVVKKGDDNGKGDEEIVVCPAQVLVPRSRLFPGASDGGSTSIGARSHISLVTETMGQTEVDY